MPNCLALVSRVSQTAGAPFVHAYSSPAAVACTHRTSTRLAGATSRSIEAVIAVPWAGATARAAGGLVIVGHSCVASTGTNGKRHSLNNATLAGTMTGEHTVVYREVAADHVSSGSSSVLGQLVTLVVDIGRVLSVVDTDCATITVAGPVCLEERVGPVSPLAKACNAVSLSSVA